MNDATKTENRNKTADSKYENGNGNGNGNRNREHGKIYREKKRLILAIAIFLIVLVGFHSRLFTALGIYNYSSQSPRIELDVLQLQRFGIDADALESDVNRLVVSMNNAQQGTHFLLGMISGLVFSHPLAGLSVGILKESYDFIKTARRGDVNKEYFIDASVDTAFWFLGGFVGFYLLSLFFDFLQSRNIRSPKRLLLLLGKGAWRAVRKK